MANIINVIERFNQAVKELKNEGLYVSSKLEFDENGETGEVILLVIKADNYPR